MPAVPRLSDFPHLQTSFVPRFSDLPRQRFSFIPWRAGRESTRSVFHRAGHVFRSVTEWTREDMPAVPLGV